MLRPLSSAGQDKFIIGIECWNPEYRSTKHVFPRVTMPRSAVSNQVSYGARAARTRHSGHANLCPCVPDFLTREPATRSDKDDTPELRAAAALGHGNSHLCSAWPGY
ncbi:hypothetical protein S40285_10220 [Stachybotrys chlorohalonatus IBT 40285]|uniref:Uncharacterized protein n=1 Tax=Stachybotrys chlorohalonatus (strain IBT 40285) TaxID=1283841 RepID=A0A084QV24_STAC4|nr:hypothetical protein S40285_10220 [Stachybotrys chlorohalonata IBT 40285]